MFCTLCRIMVSTLFVRVEPLAVVEEVTPILDLGDECVHKEDAQNLKI